VHAATGPVFHNRERENFSIYYLMKLEKEFVRFDFIEEEEEEEEEYDD